MADVPGKLNFLIFITLKVNLNCHMWPVATILDSAVLGPQAPTVKRV